MDRTLPSQWTIRGLYLFGLVLLLAPLSDLISTVWPLMPGELPWRYGFLGLSAGYIHTPMLGLTIALATAHWEGNTTALRFLGYATGVVAVLLLVVMGVFMLDLLQMRGLRAAEAQRGVLIGGLLQEAKYGTAVLVLLALGVGSVKTAGRASRSSSGRRADTPGVVKTPR